MTNQPQASTEITVTHRYDAPPERLFNAWLDAERASEWLFATPGGVMTKVAIDGQVGGGFTIIERRGDEEAAHYGTFTELARPTRLAFTFTAVEEGAGSPVTVDIVPFDTGSELTLTHTIAPEWAAYADQVRQGWERMLASLERVLTG